MYNPGLKERFIRERLDNEGTASGYAYKFGKAEKYEEQLGRDLSTFTANEIVSMYRGLLSTSLESLLVTNSNFTVYTDFCIASGLVPDSQNHYREISNDILQDCVYTLKKDQKILTREEVLVAANQLANPGDAFTILALFEGIRGAHGCDLFYARCSDIRDGVMYCHSGKAVAVSQELQEYARRSADEYNYYCYRKDGSEQVVEFDADDDKILKRYRHAKPDDQVTAPIMSARIKHRIMRIRDAVGMSAINSMSLLESGRIDMVNRLMREEGNFDAVEVALRHREEIEERYGYLSSSVKRWVLKNKKYLVEG